ncbi:MAG TPA: DUF5709 domain-containing protein, partial [Microlunatus sp.]|nr:DUF5709 domain-containing protein [Microlunatus sp.]
ENMPERESVPDELDQLDQDLLQPESTLEDRGVDDFLDEGYSPPERPSALIRQGLDGQSLADRLEAEQPEVWEEDPGTPLPGEAGARAGRLVDPDEGIGPDLEAQAIGTDVGIDGAAASAEEAAVHIVEGDDLALDE